MAGIDLVRLVATPSRSITLPGDAALLHWRLEAPHLPTGWR